MEAAVYYVPTDEQIADPLTKPLDGGAFIKHRMALLESVGDRKGDAVRKLTEQEIKATETKPEYFKTQDILIGDSESNYHRLNEVDNGAAAPTGGVLGENAAGLPGAGTGVGVGVAGWRGKPVVLERGTRDSNEVSVGIL